MGNKFITVRLNEREMFLKSKTVVPNYRETRGLMRLFPATRGCFTGNVRYTSINALQDC
jgi:hypothetical protein